MTPNLFFYKIRRDKDGKYSTGGQWPNFGRHGKVWWTMSALKAHLNLVIRERYEGCSLVIFSIQEANVTPILVNDKFTIR